MKNKLTKAMARHLQALANQMPDQQYYALTKIETGAEVLARDPAAKLAGQQLESEKKYKTAQPYPVNHFRRLRTAYESGGEAAVQRYLQPFVRTEADRKKLLAAVQ